MRCKIHPAYEADYCPSCGTARVIGEQVWADLDATEEV
jgi:hypothetical protein